MAVEALKQGKKAGFALFLDKIDQFIDPPGAEDAPEDCEKCEYQESVILCDDPKKYEQNYCAYECRDMCCFRCSLFSDSNAGMKTRTPSSKKSPLFSHVNYWQYFQLTLINAAYLLKQDFNGGIKVFFTVREEALHCEDNIFGDRKAKIFGIFKRIYYKKDEQRTIFYESIQNERNELMLYDINAKWDNPEYAFVGTDSLCHPYVKGEKESVFDSIYRHSFDRARDVQYYGQALAEALPTIRTLKDKLRSEYVKQIIENTSAKLLLEDKGLPCYYEEKMDIMPRFWRDRQHFLRLIIHLEKNLLFDDELIAICRSFNNEMNTEDCDGKHCFKQNCSHHPFSFLYNLGLLGIVKGTRSYDLQIEQFFLNSNEITYFHEKDDLFASKDICYVIHPALTKTVEKLKNRNIMHFNGFVLGKGLPVTGEQFVNLMNDHDTMSKAEFESKYFA